MELILIPLVVAILACFVPKQMLKYFSLAGAIASLVVVSVHALAYCGSSHFVTLIDPGFITAFGLSFKMAYDGMSLFMLVLTSLIFLLIVLSNFNNETASSKKFVAMIFLMLFALNGVFTSMDGMVFYIFWEITLIPVFLIALWYGAENRKKALMKFFIYTFIGSLAMLLSLIAIKVNAASFAHSDLMAVELSSKAAFWIMGGFFLAFAIKAPIFPFHTWQPDTYTVSPMAGTMLLSALMLKMALYGMVRWMIPLAPEAMEFMLPIIVVLSLIGIVYTAILAIKGDDIKRIFAFASISHVGLIAAGIMLFNKDALSAAFLQMFNHSLVAIGLFLAAGILEQRLNTRNLYEMGGIAKLAPKFGFWFAVIGFASVSVPFSSGFIGEFLLLKELYEYKWIVGLLAGTTLVFGAVYTLRAYQLSMFGPAKIESFIDLSWNEWLVFFVLGIVVLALGLFPQIVFDFVGPSIENLMESVELSKNIVK